MLRTATRLLIAAGILAISGATTAQAALFQQVYSGTISYGYDYAGLFGAGSNLTGLAYTATYLIDDSKGVYGESKSPYYAYSYVYGGMAHGQPSPVSGKLTIGSTTISLDGNDYGSTSRQDAYSSGYSEYVGTYSRDTKLSSNGNSYISSYIHNLAYTDYTTLTSSSLSAPATFVPVYGEGSYYTSDSIVGTQTYLTFNVTRFTSSAAAVPEPASWTLMIGGFGIAGGALRRRPRRIAITA